MRELTVALCQMDATPHQVDANVEACKEILARAADAGADIAVLPELIATSWPATRDQTALLAETITDSRSVASWLEIASISGMWIIGGFIELSSEGQLFNSVAIVSPNGVEGRYRKLHLFGTETETFDPGNLGFPVFEVSVRGKAAKIGIAVCYDLRFPETIRILSSLGADIVAVPTGWVTGFDRTGHLEDGMTPQGRSAALQANLSQVFLAIADRVGVDEIGAGRSGKGRLAFLGASCIVDPFGGIPNGPASSDREELIVAGIDLDHVGEARERGAGISPLKQRRCDVYERLLGYRPELWESGQRPPF